MRSTLPLSLLLSSLLSFPSTNSTPVNTTLISRDDMVASTLSVTTYLKKGCKGDKYDHADIEYTSIYAAAAQGLWNPDPFDGQRMQSYLLSRAIDPSEVLEFTAPVLSPEEQAGFTDGSNNPCGDVVDRAPTGKAGCHNVKKAVCLRLKHH